MLYLDSLANQAESKTEYKYAICHEKVPGMVNIAELAPSKELLSQWSTKSIGWEEFSKRFKAEMRAEYKNDKSRLKGLADYSKKNDVTLYSPEPPGEQTYRTILGEVVNLIWQREGGIERVIDLTQKIVQPDPRLTDANRQKMEEIASACELFTPTSENSQKKSCQVCDNLDRTLYVCLKMEKVFIDYEWEAPK